MRSRRFGIELKDWTIQNQLPSIDVPTLLINGRYDLAQDFAVQDYFLRVPKIKWITFDKSSHVPHWEERERVMEILRQFFSL
jgi:pimeloyl-ACP methyl ester carboxylesterase